MMDVIVAELSDNPYVSPSSAPVAKPAAPPAAGGSLGMIFAGFVLLLGGYFISNLFLISDLYHIGMGPNGKVIPSPLAAQFSTPVQQWMLYLASAAAFVAGAVMIGSQRFNPLAVVCYVMCPLVGAIYLIASPLRVVRKYAEPVAAGYLLVGSCLCFTGATQLFLLYGQPTNGLAPVAVSMMTEVGLAFIVGAMVKYWHIPASQSGPGPAIVLAELVTPRDLTAAG